jgi:cytochrome c peroxidase
MEAAAQAGFRHILFYEPDPDDLKAVQEYIRSLEPEPSPYLKPNGGLSGAARRGKALFDNPKVGCATCHPAPLYTDLKLHDVATSGELDRTREFDTPTLVELWATGPYLHDGSATTLREVLTTSNKDDKHGATSHLSKKEIDALVAYLLSL